MATDLTARNGRPAVEVTRAGYMCLLMGTAWLCWPWDLLAIPAVALLAVVSVAWARWLPASFGRMRRFVLGRLWRRSIARNWATVIRHCGLAEFDVPVVRRTRVRYPHVELLVRPGLGQTVGDFESAGEAVRTGLGASRVRIEAVDVRDVRLTFTMGDVLRTAFDARPGQPEDHLDSIRVGRREDGKDWRLPIGPHTLVAGCSGAGKGSVFWSFTFGLAPAVRSGRVQLHGIDLKGGMEILMAESLFTTVATNAGEAVAVLELLVEWMRERAQGYAGRVRSHTPTADKPLHIVLIDELAALTAYCGDRELQRRAENAINLLCSQGRAPGFMVFACLQDPRKEVIPSRGLFTQMVGLRLKDLSETSMVLGESAVATGAYCHRIARDMPGTGYVLPEDGGHPIRVRAGFASDAAIRDVADRFASPARVPIVAVEPSSTGRTRGRPTEVVP